MKPSEAAWALATIDRYATGRPGELEIDQCPVGWSASFADIETQWRPTLSEALLELAWTMDEEDQAGPIAAGGLAGVLKIAPSILAYLGRYASPMLVIRESGDSWRAEAWPGDPWPVAPLAGAGDSPQAALDALAELL